MKIAKDADMALNKNVTTLGAKYFSLFLHKALKIVYSLDL